MNKDSINKDKYLMLLFSMLGRRKIQEASYDDSMSVL